MQLDSIILSSFTQREININKSLSRDCHNDIKKNTPEIPEIFKAKHQIHEVFLQY